MTTHHIPLQVWPIFKNAPVYKKKKKKKIDQTLRTEADISAAVYVNILYLSHKHQSTNETMERWPWNTFPFVKLNLNNQPGHFQIHLLSMLQRHIWMASNSSSPKLTESRHSRCVCKLFEESLSHLCRSHVSPGALLQQSQSPLIGLCWEPHLIKILPSNLLEAAQHTTQTWQQLHFWTGNTFARCGRVLWVVSLATWHTHETLWVWDLNTYEWFGFVCFLHIVYKYTYT